MSDAVDKWLQAEEFREPLRQSLKQVSVPPNAIDEVVDLTIHAVAQARQAIYRVATSANSPAAQECVFSTAMQVFGNDALSHADTMIKLAKDGGLTVLEARMEVNRG